MIGKTTLVLVMLLVASSGSASARQVAFAPGCDDGDDGANDHCCPLTTGWFVGSDSKDLNACLAWVKEWR